MNLTPTLFIFFLCLSLSVNGQSYDLEEISVAPFKNKIQRTGKLDFKRTLNLSFKSAGYLTSLSVDDGDYFKKNQVLGSLDTTELTQQKNSTYAQLLKEKRDVKRIAELLTKRLSSQKELDDAKTRLETLRAAYKINQYNLIKAQIIAPFDGIVLARYTELGELQTPGREILKVASLLRNWVVKVALTETEISQVRLKQKVKVRLHNLGAIVGVISKIPAIANGQSNLFTIEVLLPELTYNTRMIAGQLAQVIIDFNSNEVVYRTPISALVGVDENGLAIIVTQSKDDNELNQQTFEIYKIDNRFIYLSANINDNSMQIVTKGWQQLAMSGQ